MKSKIIYLILVICCLSLFSAAKQSGRRCDLSKCPRSVKMNSEQELKVSSAAGYDSSPVRLFHFTI